MTEKIKRVLLIILDGCGIGHAPDADKYGDEGANTLKHLSEVIGGIKLPTLEKLGLGNIVEIVGVSPTIVPFASFGKGIELSAGKDTISGHFEIAGVILSKPFATYPDGFPEDVINKFCQMNNLSGVLGNKHASGTEIIKELGKEHLLTKKPIVYTSADSVFQIACHEETYGLENLYKICANARLICNDLSVARVIARPFVKKNGHFIRTRNRKDFSIDPPNKTLMDALQLEKIKIIGFGKIPSIYNYKGFDEQIQTQDNDDGMDKLINLLNIKKEAFYFINLIDFDMLYGHRRDSKGFAKALISFDKKLENLLSIVNENDLIIITADHGNDPTFKGTDHTREITPILVYLKNVKGRNIGTIQGFHNIAASIYYFLTKKNFRIGKNFVHV